MEKLVALVLIGVFVWKFAENYMLRKEIKRCPHCNGENHRRQILDPSPYAVGFDEVSELNHARTCPNFRMS